MILLYLFIFGSSKTIYLNVSALENQKCDSNIGCNILKANSSIETSDHIVLLNSNLEKEDAKRFLDFINSTVFKNITLTGRSNNSRFSTISDPGYPPSEFASIHVENATFSISNIHFQTFTNPILNGMKSSYTVSNCTFSKSKCTASPLLAFVESYVIFNNTEIHDNDANTQSLFVAVNSSITLYRLNTSTNFMESRDIRAAFHFLNTSVVFENSLFFSNTLKLPIIASSNYSSVTCLNNSFDFNNAFAVIALEFESSAKFILNSFHNNNCALAAGGLNSTVSLLDSIILNHNSDEFLIGLSESDIYLSNCTFKDSSFASIVYHNLIENFTKPLKIENVEISNVKAKITLFSAVNGKVSINNVIIDKVKSEAEIVVFSQQGNGTCEINNTSLVNVQSESKVSTALSSMNSTLVHLNNFSMTQNLICGGLFENTSLTIENSHFLNNQCLPQGNALPLAIITSSLSSGVTIRNALFESNTALSGSLFFLNSTTTVKDVKISSTQAVQGSAIFMAGTNMTVNNVTFSENNAMAMGGAIMMTQSNCVVDNCTFDHNQAPEGAAVVIRDCYDVTIKNSIGVRNNSTNGSFINADGGEQLKLTLENIEVDDPFDNSMFIQFPDRAILKNAKFNCKVKCQILEKLTPRPIVQKDEANAQKIVEKKNEDVKNEDEKKDQNKEFDDLDNPDVENENENDNENQDLDNLSNDSNDISLPIIWVMIPLSFIIAAILFIKCGPRGLQKAFNKLFKDNGKREL